MSNFYGDVSHVIVLQPLEDVTEPHGFTTFREVVRGGGVCSECVLVMDIRQCGILLVGMSMVNVLSIYQGVCETGTDSSNMVR